jgi:hypothetical protein
MNDSPFWVMTVPPAIIRDHVDIFNPTFFNHDHRPHGAIPGA